MVQNNSCMVEFPAFLPPTNLGLPMHSPSALTEHVSLNLARFFLLDPVLTQSSKFRILDNTFEEQKTTRALDRSMLKGEASPFIVVPLDSLTSFYSCSLPPPSFFDCVIKPDPDWQVHAAHRPPWAMGMHTFVS